MPKKRLVEISNEQWKNVKVYAIVNDLLIKQSLEAILTEFFNSKGEIYNIAKK